MSARTSGRSDIVDIAAELRRETSPGDPDSGAYLIFDGTREVWVPKAWMALEKGLI